MAPGDSRISAVTTRLSLSNKRPFTSQPGKRVFFHSICAGRTTWEWVSSVSCLAFGVTASMGGLLHSVAVATIIADRTGVALQPSFANRRLERQPGVPGKVDPGVLGHFGNEGVDQRPAHGLGVDRGEMRARQQRANDLGGLAGVDEIVDDQHARTVALAQ